MKFLEAADFENNEMSNTIITTILFFTALISFIHSRRTTKETTKDIGPPTRWMTILPPEEKTPSTPTWDEALGFDKIQVLEPRMDPSRGKLDEKYFCKRDDKKVARGFHYFEFDKCLVWHCPKWPIPVGVWEFEYHNCTEIDVRIWPIYHKECRINRCRTKRIDLKEELTWPTIPEKYRTVRTYWTGTVFPDVSDI